MTDERKYRRKRNIIAKRGVPMLSVESISAEYGFHPNTIRAWVTRNGLRHIRHGPGGKIFIRQDDVERFIKFWYPEDEEETQ